MMEKNEALKRIEKMNNYELRVAVAIIQGWKLVGQEETMVDEDGEIIAINPQGMPLHVPHFDEDLNLAFLLAKQYALSMIPVRSPESGNVEQWMATNVPFSMAEGQLTMDTSESMGFLHSLPCIVICKAVLALEFLSDLEAAQAKMEEALLEKKE